MITYFCIITLLTFLLCIYKRISKNSLSISSPKSIYDRLFHSTHKDTNKEKKENDTNKEVAYKNNILLLLAIVMKADGKQQECELDRVKNTIRRYYSNETEQIASLLVFQNFLDIQSYNINEICSTIKKELDYVGLSELVMELLALAYADDKYSKKEKETIENIVNELELSPTQFNSIYTIFLNKYKQGCYNEQHSSEYSETTNEGPDDKGESSKKFGDYIQNGIEVVVENNYILFVYPYFFMLLIEFKNIFVDIGFE